MFSNKTNVSNSAAPVSLNQAVPPENYTYKKLNGENFLLKILKDVGDKEEKIF